MGQIADFIAEGIAPGKRADRRSRELLTRGDVTSVEITDEGHFIATVRHPFRWGTTAGVPQYASIYPVYINVPVAIGDDVLMETLGDGPRTVYLGSRIGQPRPLQVGALVTGSPYRIELASGGPSSALAEPFQWYRKLGSFTIRGESSAFAASATFEGLTQATPELTSKLTATEPVSVNIITGIGTADLSEWKTALESGIIFTGGVPFTVRLAALGPHDDVNPVKPTDSGAAWIDGEIGAGFRGAVINPGALGSPELSVSFDAAFDVGSDGAGRKYDLYLVVAADGNSAPVYTATRIRLNILEAAWNTDYRASALDNDGH